MKEQININDYVEQSLTAEIGTLKVENAKLKFQILALNEKINAMESDSKESE